MNVGDTFKRDKKTYTILRIYPNKHSEKDLLLCLDENGLKECFHRIDVEEVKRCIRSRIPEEIKSKIKELLLEGQRQCEIIDKISKDFSYDRYKAKSAVESVKAQSGIRYHKSKKKIEQLDFGGNVIKVFESVQQASDELGISRETIYKNSKKRRRRSKYIFRYAEVEDDN